MMVQIWGQEESWHVAALIDLHRRKTLMGRIKKGEADW